MNYLEFLILVLPEAVLTMTALIVIGLGAKSGRGGANPFSSGFLTAIGAAGIVAAGLVLALLPAEASLGGMLVLDPLTRLFKWVILAMSLLTLALVPGWAPPAHRGEYLGLILFATVGLSLVISSEDLLMIFLALELASLSLYILAGYNCDDSYSAEAAMKYFLFGSISAAFLLFGMSLVYGYTGSTHLAEIGAALADLPTEPIFALGVVMMLAGLGFKVVAVPFHLWAPDAYQGAPAPSAALIASGSKVAGFFILAKILLLSFADWDGSADWGGFATGWVPFLALLAALSMVFGNLSALAQTSVRRLLAYSAVAHGGYILLGLLSGGTVGIAAVLFYITLYGMTAIGAFGVVALVEQRRGGDSVAHFAGLAKEAPFTAGCFLVFLISLAGIPPLAGFFGKFFLFTSALGGSAAGDPSGLVWLVSLGLGMNVLSLYYYLRVLKQVFARPPAESTGHATGTPPLLGCMLATTAGAIIFLGCFPNLLLKPIEAALRVVG